MLFNSPNYVTDDNQLWYIDDQPDGSFMIVSKKNRKVLACTLENGNDIVIQECSGEETQKWLVENDQIVSSKHHTVIISKQGEIELLLMVYKL